MIKNFLILVLTIISIASLSINYVFLNNRKLAQQAPNADASPSAAIMAKSSITRTPTRMRLSPTPTIEPLTEDQIFQKAYDTGIPFGPVTTGILEWGDASGMYPLKARVITAKNVPSGSSNKLTLFLKENGYQEDQYNQRYGTVTGDHGLRNQHSLCKIYGQVSNYSEIIAKGDGPDITPTMNSHDIYLACTTLKPGRNPRYFPPDTAVF